MKQKDFSFLDEMIKVKENRIRKFTYLIYKHNRTKKYTFQWFVARTM